MTTVKIPTIKLYVNQSHVHFNIDDS